MAYGDFKDLKRRAASGKILRDIKHLILLKILNMMFIKEGLLLWFFDKKSTGSDVNVPLEFNEQLAKELHKPIIRKLKKKKVYSAFKDNIWGADLADMQLISKDLSTYYVLLIFLVNMLGSFL